MARTKLLSVIPVSMFAVTTVEERSDGEPQDRPKMLIYGRLMDARGPHWLALHAAHPSGMTLFKGDKWMTPELHNDLEAAYTAGRVVEKSAVLPQDLQSEVMIPTAPPAAMKMMPSAARVPESAELPSADSLDSKGGVAFEVAEEEDPQTGENEK